MCTKKAVRGKVALLILAFISLGIDLLMLVVQLSNKYSFNIFGWIFWIIIEKMSRKSGIFFCLINETYALCLKNKNYPAEIDTAGCFICFCVFII